MFKIHLHTQLALLILAPMFIAALPIQSREHSLNHPERREANSFITTRNILQTTSINKDDDHTASRSSHPCAEEYGFIGHFFKGIFGGGSCDDTNPPASAPNFPQVILPGNPIPAYNDPGPNPPYYPGPAAYPTHNPFGPRS